MKTRRFVSLFDSADTNLLTFHVCFLITFVFNLRHAAGYKSLDNDESACSGESSMSFLYSGSANKRFHLHHYAFCELELWSKISVHRTHRPAHLAPHAAVRNYTYRENKFLTPACHACLLSWLLQFWYDGHWVNQRARTPQNRVLEIRRVRQYSLISTTCISILRGGERNFQFAPCELMPWTISCLLFDAAHGNLELDR
jgi:hypothetical protein